jgi:hypothetical protein
VDGYVDPRANKEKWTAYMMGIVPALARTESVQTATVCGMDSQVLISDRSVKLIMYLYLMLRVRLRGYLHMRVLHIFLWLGNGRGLDSSVDIAKGYGPDNRDSIPVCERDFSYLNSVQSGSGAHPAPYAGRAGGTIPEGKATGV